MINKNLAARTRSTQHKKGFTLTEIAIVLGIIGLILGAIWTAAAGVYQNQRTSHANTAVLQIAQAVRTLYATSATTGVAANTDLTANLITAGVIPTDLVNGAVAIDPWAGGATKVTSPATADSFTIEMTAVPKASCIALMTSVGGTSRDQGLFAVGSTTASAPVTAGTAGTALGTTAGQITAITPSIATTACSSATSNLIQFGFSLK